MDKGSLEILKENLAILSSSLMRLQYSYSICKKIGLKENYSEEEFIAFEAMTSRYARTTDILVNKTLRSLDAAEYIDGGTVIDATHNAEKRGIVNSEQDLRALKDLRNSIAHEYVTENIIRFFTEVLEHTPILAETIKKLECYCAKIFIDVV
jgi:uncharacterized protein YutE (UPF0331/DUF86 family)